MSTEAGLQKIADTSGTPVDPNVRVPDSVKQAADRAAAIHAAAYADPAAVVQQNEPGIQIVEHQPTAAEIAARSGDDRRPLEQPAHQEQRAAADPAAAQNDFTDAAPPEALRDSEWARRYNSMKGRYDALVRSSGGMEEQMRQMAVELTRTQELLSQSQQAAPVNRQQANHGNVITEEDRQSYGDDLIDLARRAAQDVLGPEVANLKAENARLTNSVQKSGRREMFVAMDRDVPNWRAINRDPRFLGWLRLPNIYTGQPRGVALDAAVKDANASRAAQVFKDFLAEANATGQSFQQVQTEQLPVPRTPALSLDDLAAPGRARPATGDASLPASKPIYTRTQISKFYDDKRRGLYAGREADVSAFENDLGAAQREGRIHG